MSDESAAAKVLTPFEKRIAQLILEGYNRADVATVLRISTYSLRARISLMYRKLGIKNDGIHDQKVMFLRLIHDRGPILGLRARCVIAHATSG